LGSGPSPRAGAHPYGEEDAQFFLDIIVRNEWVWAIIWRTSGELVGMIGLTPEAGHDAAELGYYVDRRHWGIGIATEAAKAVVYHGIHALSVSGSSRPAISWTIRYRAAS
jgi:[ribosomal protein S5]-alanine N-acetyltransferase